MAHRYGLASAADAAGYWQHAILGERLRECVQLLLQIEGRSVHQIFGTPDDLKLGSCLTLFEFAVPGEALFGTALMRLFDGRRDQRTPALLQR